MEVFKEKMSTFFKTEIQLERNREFYRQMNGICAEKCFEFEKAGLNQNEKECIKNCETKLYQDFLPIYHEYNRN